MPSTLRINDDNWRVHLLQECLTSKGLLKGSDGYFGPGTEGTVKLFQQSNQLQADGIVGKQTWAKLIEGRFPAPTTLPLDKFQVEFIFNNEIVPDQLDALNSSMKEFGILTPRQIRHYLPQIAHESAGLVYMREIHDGSDYEGREDLGNIEPGDGVRFPGYGPIQTTGRDNYQRLADHLGDQRIMEGIEYVSQHISPFTASAFWWYDNNMNSMVDRGATCREISARVNGADPANGLEEREDYYEIAGEVIFE